MKKDDRKYNQIRKKEENNNDENSIVFSSIHTDSKVIIFDNVSIYFQLHRSWISHWFHTPNHLVVQFK